TPHLRDPRGPRGPPRGAIPGGEVQGAGYEEDRLGLDRRTSGRGRRRMTSFLAIDETLHHAHEDHAGERHDVGPVVDADSQMNVVKAGVVLGPLFAVAVDGNTVPVGLHTDDLAKREVDRA